MSSYSTSTVTVAMAAAKPVFSYASLFRAIRSCEPTTYRSIRSPPTKARLHTTTHHKQETQFPRYGPAATTHLPPPSKPAEVTSQKSEEPKSADPKFPQDVPEPVQKEHKEDPDSNPSHEDVEHRVQRDGAASDYAGKDVEAQIEDGQPLGNKELDIVLSVPSPSEIKGTHPRHPHLEASPYEHHFDTYSLVQTLASEKAYAPDQAVTLMKAIRLMLAINLDVAKDGLVSKSDTENEAYLFRAACSELRTTLQTQRHSEMLKQRSQRAQLQHESDLLNQKVTQDLMTMREDLKGMFNDRKLGLEEQKRQVSGKIQELNHKITVTLNSEAKSEAEGLRWILTRRAATAIATCACTFPILLPSPAKPPFTFPCEASNAQMLMS